MMVEYTVNITKADETKIMSAVDAGVFESVEDAIVFSIRTGLYAMNLRPDLFQKVGLSLPLRPSSFNSLMADKNFVLAIVTDRTNDIIDRAVSEGIVASVDDAVMIAMEVCDKLATWLGILDGGRENLKSKLALIADYVVEYPLKLPEIANMLSYEVNKRQIIGIVDAVIDGRTELKQKYKV